jgi:hypothetical protein
MKTRKAPRCWTRFGMAGLPLSHVSIETTCRPGIWNKLSPISKTDVQRGT